MLAFRGYPLETGPELCAEIVCVCDGQLMSGCAVLRASPSLDAQFGILLSTGIANVVLDHVVLDGSRFNRCVAVMSAELTRTIVHEPLC